MLTINLQIPQCLVEKVGEDVLNFCTEEVVKPSIEKSTEKFNSTALTINLINLEPRIHIDDTHFMAMFSVYDFTADNVFLDIDKLDEYLIDFSNKYKEQFCYSTATYRKDPNSHEILNIWIRIANDGGFKY